MELIADPPVTAKPPEGVGFPLSRARRVVEKHNQTHDITKHNFSIRLHLKSTDEGADLVAVTRLAHRGKVLFAFRALPDISETPLTEIRPLDLVRAMANKFGLELGIGDKTEKFFLDEQIAIRPGTAPSHLIDIKNPENHSFVSSCFLQLVDPGHVDITLAWALDTSRYAEWLGSNI